MTIVVSPVAETDLEEIGDYIALANPRRAVTFVRVCAGSRSVA